MGGKKPSLTGGFQGGFRPVNTLGYETKSPSQTARFLLEDSETDDLIEPVVSDIRPGHSHKPARSSHISKRPLPTSAEEPASTLHPRQKKARRASSPDVVSLDETTPTSKVTDRKGAQATVEKKTTPRSASHVSPGTYQTKSKRVRAESVGSSADELAENNSPRKTMKRGDGARPPRNERTAAVTLQPRRPQDMQKTKFTRKIDGWEVARAYAGNHTYVGANSSEPSRLQIVQASGEGPNKLIVYSLGGDRVQLPWLEISIHRCTRIRHAGPALPIVLLNRPASNDTPSFLGVEFKTRGEYASFMTWVTMRAEAISTVKVEMVLLPEDKVKSSFENLFKQCSARSQGKATTAADDVEYLEHQDSLKAQQTGFTATTFAVKHLDEKTEQPEGPRERLKDLMKTETVSTNTPKENEKTNSTPSPNKQVAQVENKRASRETERSRTRRSALKPPAPEPIRWIDTNPQWADIWNNQPLIYPPVGRNSAQVTMEDIPRLEEGELMNDNLIVFYLRYLQHKLETENPSLFQRVYFMNPWFYAKLTRKRGRGIDYDAVKSWTTKVNLLSYDYIFVPVNEHMHWYLAVICNPSKLLPTKAECRSEEPSESVGSLAVEDGLSDDQPSLLDEKVGSDLPRAPVVSDLVATAGKPEESPKTKSIPDPTGARVITLDSLGGTHSPTCTNLREYLLQEIKFRRNVEIEVPHRFGMTAKGIPEQEDFSSCGAYLLGYVERFLQDPDAALRNIVEKVGLGWDIDPNQIRRSLRDNIMQLRKEQNERMEEERSKKKAKAQLKATQSASAAVSSPAAAPASPGTNDPAKALQVPHAPHSDPPSRGSPQGSYIGHGTCPHEAPTACAEHRPNEPIQSPDKQTHVTSIVDRDDETNHVLEPLSSTSEEEEEPNSPLRSTSFIMISETVRPESRFDVRKCTKSPRDTKNRIATISDGIKPGGVQEAVKGIWHSARFAASSALSGQNVDAARGSRTIPQTPKRRSMSLTTTVDEAKSKEHHILRATSEESQRFYTPPEQSTTAKSTTEKTLSSPETMARSLKDSSVNLIELPDDSPQRLSSRLFDKPGPTTSRFFKPNIAKETHRTPRKQVAKDSDKGKTSVNGKSTAEEGRKGQSEMPDYKYKPIDLTCED